MKSLILTLSGGLLLLATLFNPARAQPIAPFAPPAGFALSSTVQHDPNGRPLLYGGTSPAANWNIAPMGGPGDFTSLAPIPGGGWGAGAPWAAIRVTPGPGGFTETIRQDGSHAACRNANGGPEEFDLFIQPNSRNSTYPQGVNPAFYARQEDFPALGQLASLKVNGTFTLLAGGPAASFSPCAVNHAGASYGLILLDSAVSPRQMFWYGVDLAHVCVPPPPPASTADYRSCLQGQAHPHVWWYWTGLQSPGRQVSRDATGAVNLVNFAVGDTPQSVGLTTISDHGPHALSLDFLPRLAALIGSGKDGIDPDLDHWKLAGVTLGQALWGNTVLATSWQGFVPVWTLKPHA